MADNSHLLVRKDHIICTICFASYPINAGRGTPMPAMISAYEALALKHPREPHQTPEERRKNG